MAVRIRLKRGGRKKRPYYRIVVADARAPRDGRFKEVLGHYDPLMTQENPNRVVLNEERIRYWLEKGAQPTDRVHRFLDSAGLLKRSPRHNPQKALPGKKAQERLAERKAAEEEAAA